LRIVPGGAGTVRGSERIVVSGEWDTDDEGSLAYVLRERPFAAPFPGSYSWRVDNINEYGIHGNEQYGPDRYPWFGEDLSGNGGVRAMFEGRIVAAGQVYTGAGYVGYYMDLSSPNGVWLARYVHVDPAVEVGDYVSAGETIAQKSTDMTSLWPHLHLGLVWRNNQGNSARVVVPAKEVVDPLPSGSYGSGSNLASMRADYFDFITKLRE
jgi:murein DD-endopeptidase MepM/ murein hydrolase activator NlpD